MKSAQSNNSSGETRVGGQAVIEGVMMRSPVGAAVAVRSPEGGIIARHLGISMISDSHPIWKKPVFRGAAVLIDTLRTGLKALNWSASVAEGPRSGGEKKHESLVSFLTTAAAIVLAVILFAWLPLQLSKWILSDGGTPADQLFVHLLAGGFRLIAFLVYLLAISLMPDVKRLFMYHGAEHQTIHAFEQDLEPLEEMAVEQSPLHQRCGTSFLLLVMMATIFFYAIFDSAVIFLLKVNPAAHWRILYHLPLIPLVMGLSYEILKVADKHLETSAIARAVTAPGLLLQKLTTRKAGADEVQVAVASLKVSLGKDAGEDVTIQNDDKREDSREQQ